MSEHAKQHTTTSFISYEEAAELVEKIKVQAAGQSLLIQEAENFLKKRFDQDKRTKGVVPIEQLLDMQNHVNKLRLAAAEESVRHLVSELTRSTGEIEAVLATRSFPMVAAFMGSTLAAQRFGRRIDDIIMSVNDEEYKKRIKMTVDETFTHTEPHINKIAHKFIPDLTPLYGVCAAYIFLQLVSNVIVVMTNGTPHAIVNTIFLFIIFVVAFYGFYTSWVNAKKLK